MSDEAKKHVFISYVHENDGQVSKLVEALETYGVEVWLDKEKIAPGRRWQDVIRDAIRDGMFFVACFSKESEEKDDTYMREEVLIAIDVLRKKSEERAWFIPVKLNECAIPDTKIGPQETLRSLQWVELYNDWNDGLQRILRVVSPEKQGLHKLISTLESGTDDIDRARAARDLGKIAAIEPMALAALVKALSAWPVFFSSSTVLTALVNALANVGEPAVPILIAALNDADARVRWVAVRALGGIGEAAKDAVPALIAALKDAEEIVRWSAAEALGKIGEAAKDAVPALIAALKDAEVNVRWSAAAALGKIGEPAKDAVSALIAALNDAEEIVRLSAADALGKIGEPAVPALIAALKDAEVNVRWSAAYALGQIGEPAKDAVPALIAALKDAEGNVRQSAAWALREIGEAAVSALIAALNDAEEIVRFSAADALREIGTPEARRALQEHGDDI